MIKQNTTRTHGQAMAIPGQVDPSLDKFEKDFFHELKNQHHRVDLFVKSKADEFSHRLGRSGIREGMRRLADCAAAALQKQVSKLIGRTNRRKGDPISNEQQRKFIIYNDRIER